MRVEWQENDFIQRAGIAQRPATGIDRREEMSLAIGRRSSPKGPSGRMSGSKNKLNRNGSTASSESGPPSWNSTMPTLFFPAKLLAPAQRILQAFNLFA